MVKARLPFSELAAKPKDETFVQLLSLELDGAIARARAIILAHADSRNSGGYPETVRDLFYAFIVATMDHNYDLARVICEIIYDLGRESAS